MDDPAGHFVRVALLDRRGQWISGDPALAKVAAADDLVLDLDDRERVSRQGTLLILRRPADGDAGDAALWQRYPAAAFLVGALDTGRLRAQLRALEQAFNLTERQACLVAALIEHGSLRASAEALGWSYTAARNALAEVKGKTGFSDLPLMVAHFLDLLGMPQLDDPLCSPALFGLTERQYALACLSGSIPSRRELAAHLGVSQAVVESELKAIYLHLDIGSAAELARLIAEVRLMIAAAVPAEPAVPSPTDELPEARLAVGGRTLAYSDYGPDGGNPVLILHSMITGRAAPSRLVAALQAAGYRPLAIDRPGFGDTDNAAPDAPRPLVVARDMVAVLDALGVSQIDLISLGSGYAAVQLAQLAPGRIRRALLVNPPPAVSFTRVDRGPIGAIKRSFAKNPLVIRTMIRLLASFASPGRMHDGMARAFRNSAPDIELLNRDPQFLNDYLLAVRDFAFGKVDGYVTEQSQWARGADFAAQPGLTHWRIVQAGHFFLHHPDQALEYWMARLPDTPVVRVPQAGQMLCYSHPGALVDALQSISCDAENFPVDTIQSGIDARALQPH